MTTRPTILSSLAYGFAIAVAISVIGYFGRNTAVAIVPVVLGLPGFLVGILSNNSFHGGKESVIAAVAAAVNTPVYFAIIHIFRLIRFKLRAKSQELKATS
jgi:hypothetical protein